MMESDNESLTTSIVSSTPSVDTAFDEEPPPYSQVDSDHAVSRAPDNIRSNSSASLGPPQMSRQDSRRTLLLVFVHGFMGNETSFQNFPAHLHNLLSVLLADSHVVHTKVYPRYHSRNALKVSSQNLSQWYGA